MPKVGGGGNPFLINTQKTPKNGGFNRTLLFFLGKKFLIIQIMGENVWGGLTNTSQGGFGKKNFREFFYVGVGKIYLEEIEKKIF